MPSSDSLPDQAAHLSDFLGTLRPGQIAMGLFEFLPEIMFWIKDRHGALVFANKAYANLLRRSPEELIGKTDADLFAPSLAQVFQSADAEVMQTGKPQHNCLEIVTRPGGTIEWRITSKIPLLNPDNEVVGTSGSSRRLDHSETISVPTPHRAIAHLIKHIHQNLDQVLTVEDLAEKAGMSLSSLERHFKRHLATTPKRYLVQARVAKACEQLLNSTLSIGQIANSLSYQEHASFTRAFRSIMHMSPKEYREYYASS